MSANPSSFIHTCAIVLPMLVSIGCVDISPPWQLAFDAGKSGTESDSRRGGQGSDSVGRELKGSGGAAGTSVAPDAGAETDAWAAHGVGGNKGVSSDGPDAAGLRSDTGADASGCSFRQCDGVADSSICWRLGSFGASCATTCVHHGGTAAAARAHIGTSAEGGSQRECQRLLGLFGIVSGVVTVSIQAGLGCHIKLGVPWPYGWTAAPAFSENASSADVRLLCGCVL